MSPELVVLLLRVVALIILYLFILAVVLVIRRDLRASSPPKARPQGWLRVLEQGDTDLSPGETLALEVVNSLGRAPENSLRLDDPFVSAAHALLTYRGQQWWLEDLGSTNGTLVNQRLIAEPTVVAYGDVIEVGKVKLRLERT